jgi:hypothetical protein
MAIIAAHPLRQSKRNNSEAIARHRELQSVKKIAVATTA